MKINRGHIVTAILFIKFKYLKEKYATLEECNFYKQILLSELNSMGISIDYDDRLDLGYFRLENEKIFKNDDISIDGLLCRYQVSDDIGIIYDDEFGVDVLKQFYGEESGKFKKIQDILAKRLNLGLK